MDSELIQFLKKKTALVSDGPGVYLHKDAQDNILYIGKAKNLKNRLSSYFSGIQNHQTKTSLLVSKIRDFDTVQTTTESESLILESNLVKVHMPPFNILLRDDKNFPYLKMTLSEPWPRLVLSRKMKQENSDIYFGPFTHGLHLHHIQTVIQKLFPLVRCSPRIFESVKRPCMFYHIKKCLAPCHLPVDKIQYKTMVENTINLLNGKVDHVLFSLKSKMKHLSDQLEFEKAGEIRDQIKALEDLKNQQSVSLFQDANLDILAWAHASNNISFFIGKILAGKFLGGRSYFFSGIDDGDKAMIQEYVSSFLAQYYKKNELPEKLLVPKLLDETDSSINSWTEGLGNVSLISTRAQLIQYSKKIGMKPKDLKKLDELISLAEKNATSKLEEGTKLNSSVHETLQYTKEFLEIPTLPRHLECFDISTFQGGGTVASQVVFRDGTPSKKDYKKYIIKSVPNQNDFASMREVISRRFDNRKIIPEPDIVLIDGGEPQVREVVLTLNKLGKSHIFVRGIAKSRIENTFAENNITRSSERIVIPELSFDADRPQLSFRTKNLKEGSPEAKFLMQARDEAHRFAITFHRKKRDNQSLKGILDTFPGLGKVRKKILKSSFSSIAELKASDIDTIWQKTKIPRALIEKIKKTIDQN